MAAHVRAVKSEEDPIGDLIRSGDVRSAVARCAKEHGAAIGRLAMALLGSQAEAEEVAQETLIAAADGMAAYRGEGSVRAWLFGIARRIAARRVETRVRQERRLRLVADGGAGVRAVDDEVDANRRALRVRELLGELKPSDREALLLRYEAGLSFAEIASACGIEEAAARKRASRGLERLRGLLGDEG